MEFKLRRSATSLQNILPQSSQRHKQSSTKFFSQKNHDGPQMPLPKAFEEAIGGAFEKKTAKECGILMPLRIIIECFGNFVYDHLSGSGHSHYGVCYQCLTPNGVRQNPLDFSSFCPVRPPRLCVTPIAIGGFGSSFASMREK